MPEKNQHFTGRLLLTEHYPRSSSFLIAAYEFFKGFVIA
jgi:hypothetical protein